MNFNFGFSFSFGQKPKESSISNSAFIANANSEIERMHGISKYSTVRNYRTALNSFSGFIADRSLSKHQLDCSILVQYQSWLHQHAICWNTSANYLRYLRALYNLQHENSDTSLFSKVETSNARTEKRSLSIADIRKLQNVELAGNKRLTLYRDVFLFSIYTFGIPFVDLVRINRSDIHNGIITYNRQKTNKFVAVALLPEAKAIADKYSVSGSDCLFPQLSSAVTRNYQQYQQQLIKYNKALRKISELAGIEVSLTSYVARHTWASIAYSNGVDIGIISQALGHTNLRTTQIYLREIDAEKMKIAGMNVMNVLQ